MKKLLLATVLSMAVAMPAFAGFRAIYYGEKARDSKKNPCKGDCKTKCGEIIYTLTLCEGYTLVEECVLDADENVISKDLYPVNDDPESIFQQAIQDLPDNADIEVDGDLYEKRNGGN